MRGWDLDLEINDGEGQYMTELKGDWYIDGKIENLGRESRV